MTGILAQALGTLAPWAPRKWPTIHDLYDYRVEASRYGDILQGIYPAAL